MRKITVDILESIVRGRNRVISKNSEWTMTRLSCAIREVGKGKKKTKCNSQEAQIYKKVSNQNGWTI